MRKLGIFLAVLILVLSTIVAFGQATETTYPQPSEYGPAILNWGPNVKYGGTVKYVMTYGKMTLNLTPFPLAGVTTIPVSGLIYEPLFYVNSLSGQVTNLLGTSYKWVSATEVIVHTRENVKWSDGYPFTAKDVAFTFNYAKSHPTIAPGLWDSTWGLRSVEASGNNTVVFRFSFPDVPYFESTLAGQVIVPEHIWENIEDPSHIIITTSASAVGTGPFLYENGSFSTANNSFELVKNPNYWMKGRPYINSFYVGSPLNPSTVAMDALLGNFDEANVNGFDPKLFVNKNPQFNKPFLLPVFLNALYFNTLKYPFNIPAFRRALVFLVDRKKLTEAYFNAVPPVNPLGLGPQQVTEWEDPTLAASINSIKYDPQMAKEILKSAGFSWDSSGRLVGPTGKVLPPFSIAVPAGFTDYVTQAGILEEAFKSVGLSVTTEQQDLGTFFSSLFSNTYDMIILGQSLGPITPYNRYNSMFNPAYAIPEPGNKQGNTGDFTMYTNPILTSALNIYRSTTDPKLQKQSIYVIERILFNDWPVIPLTYETSQMYFVESRFSGFPSYSNFYVARDTLNGASISAEMVLLNLHLK